MSGFNSHFTKFVLGSNGGLKFGILVKDFDTGGPSSITVRKEYLFAFQFWFMEFMELSVGNNQWRGEGQKALFCWGFFNWWCFNTLIVDGRGLGGSRKSHLYIRSWYYLKKWECGISPTRSLVFAHSGTFHHHRSYRRNLRSQCQLDYWVYEYFIQNNSPVPSKLHRLLPSY